MKVKNLVCLVILISPTFLAVGQVYDVQWTDIVNMQVESNNSLLKTSTVDDYDAGAASLNVLKSGQDGWVEMTITENSGTFAFGLSEINKGPDASIDFFLYPIDGTLWVYGQDFGQFLQLNVGVDRIGYTLRIERINHTIYFYINGNLRRKSTVASTGDLIADVSIKTPNTKIENVVASFGIPESITSIPNESVPISWKDFVGCQPDATNTLVKTVSSDNWDSGAASVNVLPAGKPGWIKMIIPDFESRGTFGFSEVNIDAAETSINYRFQFNGNDAFGSYKWLWAYDIEGGISYQHYSYNTLDTLKLERDTNGYINYYHNNSLVYTSNLPNNSALIADVSLYSNASKIYGATCSFGLDDDWYPNANNILYTKGNVGIGLFNPTYKLDVEGTINALDVRINGSSITSSQHWVSNGSNIEFTTGSVGIGTSTIPTDYSLVIDGKALMEEVKVQLSENWPDFVFESDYELSSLEEIENYITKNKHLQEIPSEAEVTENGINLGEMNAKLLQKIEELTLYVIELNKQNQAQQKEIDLLKSRIED